MFKQYSNNIIYRHRGTKRQLLLGFRKQFGNSQRFGQGPDEGRWNNLGEITVSLQVVSAEGCDGTPYIDTLYIVPSPSPNAGPNEEVCGYTYHMQGTLSDMDNVCEWIVASVPSGASATFTHPDNPTSYVSVTTVGQYSFVLHEIDTALNCDNFDTVTINFILPPTAPFTVDTINCYGDSTTVHYVGVTSPNSTYHWNFFGGDASTTDGPGPISVIWQNPGVHTISLWVDNQGCYSDTNVVTIYNPYPLQSELTAINPTCNDSYNGQINSYVTGGRQPYSYQWSNGSQNDAIYGITNGTFILTVTDQGGCTDIDTATVVEPDPLVVSVPDTIRTCNHDSTTIYAAATGGGYPYYYHWNTGDTTQIINIEVNGNQQYWVYVTDENGCQSAKYYINIQIPDTLQIHIIPDKDSVCPGESVLLSTEISGGLAPFDISLNGNAVYPPVSVYPNSLSHDFTVSVTDVCGSTAYDNVSIGIYPVPVLSFSADTTEGCSPLTVHFNNNTAADYYSSYWVFEDSTNLYQGDHIEHTFTEPGYYDVTLLAITNKGCKTSFTKPDFIYVYPKPVAHFITIPQTVYIITPEVNFINESEDYISSIWSFGDGDSSLADSPAHSYRDTGIYNVSLLVENDKGCIDTTTYLLVVNDVATFYVPTAFTPDNDGVNDYFRFYGRNVDEKRFYFAVYDRWGEVIWETTNFHDAWDGIAKKGKKVKPGIYVWYSSFWDLLGKYHENTGKVTVIY